MDEYCVDCKIKIDEENKKHKICLTTTCSVTRYQHQVQHYIKPLLKAILYYANLIYFLYCTPKVCHANTGKVTNYFE